MFYKLGNNHGKLKNFNKLKQAQLTSKVEKQELEKIEELSHRETKQAASSSSMATTVEDISVDSTSQNITQDSCNSGSADSVGFF